MIMQLLLRSKLLNGAVGKMATPKMLTVTVFVVEEVVVVVVVQMEEAFYKQYRH